MNSAHDFSTDSDEDSFQPVPLSHRKKKPIIDSDSEEDDIISEEESEKDFSVSHRKSDFEEEEEEEETSTIEDSFQRSLNLSKDEIVNTTYDEEPAFTDDDEIFSPVVKNNQKKVIGHNSNDERNSSGYSDAAVSNNMSHNSNNTKNLSPNLRAQISNNVSHHSNNSSDNSEGEVSTNVFNQSAKNKENMESFAIRENSIYRENRASSSSSDEDEVSEHSEQKEKHSFVDEHNHSIDSLEIIDGSQSIVEVSSDEENTHPVLKQSNLKAFLNVPKESKEKSPAVKSEKKLVSHAEYETQMKIISSLESDLLRTKNAMRIIKLESLPDKGASLIEKEKSLNRVLQNEKNKFSNMEPDDTKPQMRALDKVEVAWDEIEAGVDAVGPRTFGKKGVARFNVEKQLAVETLDHLHKSLDTCPTENDSVDDPKGLKVPLMPHQRRALAWLLWRERQKPSGGLLADDMGLGKTLTMISLVLKSHELNPDEDEGKENYRDKYPGGTLVVCPASLMNQWSGEIERRTKRGLLGVELYHGAKRETKAKRLAKHDVVITTYGLVLNESEKSGPVFGVRWRRIILDEAHQIRNYKSQTAESVFRLSGESKWALTGTPVHNKELDMYAILKFLRCQPFDDLQVWKRWISDKSTGGEMRLQAVISSLMLRRTKAELMAKGTLEALPERRWELISVQLDKDEMAVYQKVLLFSKTLFAQFLHQRAEKNQDAYDTKFINSAPPDPNGEYFKMRNKLLKLNRVKEVSQHEILLLLLRLRQICCHPSLIKQMLNGDEDLGDAEDYEGSEELNLLEQLNKMNINDEGDYLPEEKVNLKEASKGYLNPSNPVFYSERPSSKIKTLLKLLKEKVASGDKVIVVSQWTSLLDLIAIHIKEARIGFDSLNGKIQVTKRMPIVDNFNDPNSATKVLLLSLTAGGVGLNLVGANHLFLLDLHWNPQLESQAQDRIYRMGQLKPIFVYKFMATDTIEERIKALQDKKLEIAEAMLTGSRRVIDNKLSLQDLKMLFGF